MFRLYLFVFVSLLIFSCNDYQKLLNSTENEIDKYNAAEEYYQNGEFRRANALIEQIIPSYRGKPQGERLVFFLLIRILKQGHIILQQFNLRILLIPIQIVKEFKRLILWKQNLTLCFLQFTH